MADRGSEQRSGCTFAVGRSAQEVGATHALKTTIVCCFTGFSGAFGTRYRPEAIPSRQSNDAAMATQRPLFPLRAAYHDAAQRLVSCQRLERNESKSAPCCTVFNQDERNADWVIGLRGIFTLTHQPCQRLRGRRRWTARREDCTAQNSHALRRHRLAIRARVRFPAVELLVPHACQRAITTHHAPRCLSWPSQRARSSVESALVQLPVATTRASVRLTLIRAQASKVWGSAISHKNALSI